MSQSGFVMNPQLCDSITDSSPVLGSCSAMALDGASSVLSLMRKKRHLVTSLSQNAEEALSIGVTESDVEEVPSIGVTESDSKEVPSTGVADLGAEEVPSIGSVTPVDGFFRLFIETVMIEIYTAQPQRDARSRRRLSGLNLRLFIQHKTRLNGVHDICYRKRLCDSSHLKSVSLSRTLQHCWARCKRMSQSGFVMDSSAL